MLYAIFGYWIGAKIGNELFRFNNPTSLYQPPPLFSMDITATNK